MHENSEMITAHDITNTDSIQSATRKFSLSDYDLNNNDNFFPTWESHSTYHQLNQ